LEALPVERWMPGRRLIGPWAKRDWAGHREPAQDRPADLAHRIAAIAVAAACLRRPLTQAALRDGHADAAAIR
jgi:hypothetical protein